MARFLLFKFLKLFFCKRIIFQWNKKNKKSKTKKFHFWVAIGTMMSDLVWPCENSVLVPGDLGSLILNGAEDPEWSLFKACSTLWLWTCSPDLGAKCPDFNHLFHKTENGQLPMACIFMHIRGKWTCSFPNLSSASHAIVNNSITLGSKMAIIIITLLNNSLIAF